MLPVGLRSLARRGRVAVVAVNGKSVSVCIILVLDPVPLFVDEEGKERTDGRMKERTKEKKEEEGEEKGLPAPFNNTLVVSDDVALNIFFDFLVALVVVVVAVDELR